MPEVPPIAVLGAGSWGTALAIQFARGRAPDASLGAGSGDNCCRCRAARRNEHYLSGSEFPQALIVESDLTLALRGVLDVLIAVPSHAFRNVLREIAPRLAPEVRVAWATKGFEVDSGLLPHQVAREVLGASSALWPCFPGLLSRARWVPACPPR